MVSRWWTSPNPPPRLLRNGTRTTTWRSRTKFSLKAVKKTKKGFAVYQMTAMSDDENRSAKYRCRDSRCLSPRTSGRQTDGGVDVRVSTPPMMSGACARLRPIIRSTTGALTTPGARTSSPTVAAVNAADAGIPNACWRSVQFVHRTVGSTPATPPSMDRDGAYTDAGCLIPLTYTGRTSTQTGTR